MIGMNWRRIKKTLSWRVLASLITFSVAYMFTGTIFMSLKVTVVLMTIKTVAFYIHEWLWE